MRECKATTHDGDPCRSPFVDPETGYCHAHGPGAAARMSHRGQKGAAATRRRLKGQGTVDASKAPDPPETMADAKMIAAWAVQRVIVGDLDPRVAQQTASLLREFRSATKESDLAAEVKELRDVVAELKRAKK